MERDGFGRHNRFRWPAAPSRDGGHCVSRREAHNSRVGRAQRAPPERRSTGWYMVARCGSTTLSAKCAGKTNEEAPVSAVGSGAMGGLRQVAYTEPCALAKASPASAVRNTGPRRRPGRSRSLCRGKRPIRTLRRHRVQRWPWCRGPRRKPRSRPMDYRWLSTVTRPRSRRSSSNRRRRSKTSGEISSQLSAVSYQ